MLKMTSNLDAIGALPPTSSKSTTSSKVLPKIRIKIHQKMISKIKIRKKRISKTFGTG